ncbi:MAG: efflux RND transporter periplasmic adaptor subunit [Cucumibacter sp.]
MRNLISYGVALVIIIVIALWMSTGTLVRGGQGAGNGERPVAEALGVDEDSRLGQLMEEFGLKPAEEEAVALAEAEPAAGAEEPLRSVRIQTFVAQPMPIEVSLRGRTQASTQVTSRAQTTGILETRHVAKGDNVQPGDLLCTLDQGTRRVRLAQAEASLAKAQLDFDSNKTLRDRGISAANSGQAFEVALAAAQAALEEAQAELDRAEIRAEVGGIVQDPIAETGDMLSPGGVCVTLVQLDPMLFVGSVPEARIGLARTGLSAIIETVSGDAAEGEVTFISSVADAATRSFPVEIRFANPDGKIRDGLTASAKVTLGVAPAHLLPQSVLTLDDDGTLGVRAVKDSKVVFYPVNIASDTRQGVFVMGLPASLDVITLGQEYVTAGQTVAAAHADEEAQL